MKTIPLPPTSHTPAPYAGPALDQVLAQRKQFLNPGLFLYYKQPIMIVEGKRSMCGTPPANATSTASAAS